jgi:hypothetical protein
MLSTLSLPCHRDGRPVLSTTTPGTVSGADGAATGGGTGDAESGDGATGEAGFGEGDDGDIDGETADAIVAA